VSGSAPCRGRGGDLRAGRCLNLDEKLGVTVPMLDIGEPTKGRRPWER
jgi:hypothetical protein